MWLAVGLALSIVAGVALPFASRLQATGLWAGRVLDRSTDTASRPRGFQDTITAGWPSWVGFTVNAVLAGAIISAFFHAWWASVLVFVVSITLWSFLDRLPIIPRHLSWYLQLLTKNLEVRRRQLLQRHREGEAATLNSLARTLRQTYELYRQSGTAAPTMAAARSAPRGEPGSLLGSTANTGRGYSSQKGPPSAPTSRLEQFNLNDPNDVSMIDEIREKYSLLLADETHPYSRCLYRPAAPLPFPRETIRAGLGALLDFVEGRRSSAFLDPAIRQSALAEAITTALVHLDDFLDVPADQLPTDPSANARAAALLRRSTATHPE